jgi:hypothetical protein
MTSKEIILAFKQQPIVGTHFQYKIYVNGSNLVYTGGTVEVNLSYKTGANTSSQIGLGATLNDTINNTLAFLNTIFAYSGSVGGYLTEINYLRINDTIQIQIETSATTGQPVTFWNLISDFNYVTFRSILPCEIVYLTNESVSNASAIYSLANGSYQLKNTSIGLSQNSIVPSKFVTELRRSFNYVIQQSFITVLNVDNGYLPLNILNVDPFFTSGTLNVNVLQPNVTNLSLTYSIDGTTFQTSPIFTGLADGNYTISIKDVYGCLQTINVTNTGSTNSNVVTPYSFISESNSIRFIKKVEHQNCGNYKNVFNTLSCNENVQIANKFIQLFQSCDNDIRTQILSSYDSLECYAKDIDGNLTLLTASKIVNNIALEDKRDAIYYALNGSLAVLFLSGNTYDYGTTNINGTYDLNGLLPEFGTVGTWIETQYGTYQVINIVLNDQGQRSLIFNASSSIVGTVNGTLQVIYNRESYNIWELPINMNDFLDKKFLVGIRFYQDTPDVLFPDAFWVSEKMQVKTRWERSKEMIWFNSKNTDIYYYSGIQMKARLNFCSVETLVNDGSIENQKTDSEVISIDAVNYYGVEFEVNNITTGIARKLLVALKHDNLIIENVPYKLSEEPELTRQGKSNFYSIKAKLLEAGDVWNQGTANTQTIATNIGLIGLLQGDADAEYLRTL